MQFGTLLSLALVVTTNGVRLAVSEASLMDPRNYPVTRVVELLQGMMKQLEEEQKADEDVYAKLACWCETNDKEKTKAIADAEARLSQLGASIQNLIAESTRLEEEIKSLQAEVDKNQKALDEATALRTKQLAEFNEEEKDMLAAIQSLGQAITVLQKHHGGAAASASFLAGVVSTVNSELHGHTKLMQQAIPAHQKQMIASLLQQPAGGGYKAYKAQSGEIFGILEQMKANFEENLAASRKEEADAKAAYEDLKAAKEKQIEFGEAQVFDKKQRLATVDEALGTSKQDAEDTTTTLGLDQTFLANLKEKCALTDKEWSDRQKTRAEEISAVAEAIGVLSNDDAKDLFSKTFNRASSFIQVRSSSAAVRNEAAAAILKIAKKTNNPKLVELATSVRLDAFTRVKQAIDDMVTELLKQSGDEVKHRDVCVEEIDTNTREVAANTHAAKNKATAIEGLKITIKTLTAEVETLEKEIAELQTQLQRAGEDRAAEHKEFQGVLADQQETQKLLTKARDVLASFYDYRQSFLQKGKYGPEMPEGFKPLEKQGSTGVLMLLEQIIADAKALEAETAHAEEQAVAAFEKLKQETEDSVNAKGDSVTSKSAAKANAEGSLATAKSEAEGLAEEAEALHNTAGDLHKGCDYYLTNFEARQTARAEEVEALRQAKAILSGMK